MAMLLIGNEQSPIDLRGSIPAKLGALQLHWKRGRVDVKDRHTLIFHDAGHMIVDHVHYDLVKGHLHKPSEHVVDGKHYDMEIHLVHAAKHDERLAVVGIFVKRGRKRSDPLARLLGDDDHARDDFDPNTLLPPKDEHYYRYAGSLTTPPYSENVIWSVMRSPIPAAQVQLDPIPKHAREPWPRHRRYVLLGG